LFGEKSKSVDASFIAAALDEDAARAEATIKNANAPNKDALHCASSYHIVIVV